MALILSSLTDRALATVGRNPLLSSDLVAFSVEFRRAFDNPSNGAEAAERLHSIPQGPQGTPEHNLVFRSMFLPRDEGLRERHSERAQRSGNSAQTPVTRPARWAPPPVARVSPSGPPATLPVSRASPPVSQAPLPESRAPPPVSPVTPPVSPVTPPVSPVTPPVSPVTPPVPLVPSLSQPLLPYFPGTLPSLG